jgi:hypothetical protein
MHKSTKLLKDGPIHKTQHKSTSQYKKELNWADINLCSSSTVKKADLAAMWSQPDSPELVIIGWNKQFKMGDHDKSKS